MRLMGYASLWSRTKDLVKSPADRMVVKPDHSLTSDELAPVIADSANRLRAELSCPSITRTSGGSVSSFGQARYSARNASTAA